MKETIVNSENGKVPKLKNLWSTWKCKHSTCGVCTVLKIPAKNCLLNFLKTLVETSSLHVIHDLTKSQFWVLCFMVHSHHAVITVITRLQPRTLCLLLFVSSDSGLCAFVATLLTAKWISVIWVVNRQNHNIASNAYYNWNKINIYLNVYFMVHYTQL